jgi:hypothetical protein
MGDARRRLGAGEGEKAEGDQEKAENYLDQAEEELEEEERRYRNWQQEELLFRIRKELSKLVQEQDRINGQTRRTDVARIAAGGALTRLQRFELKDLSEAQKKQAAQVDYIVAEIEKEGSQVFGFILVSVADDMKEIARRLVRLETGVFVQEMQADVLKKLKELEAVFAAEIKRRQQGKRPQGGQQKRPLVPPAAELLMLRMMQQDVNYQLRRFLDGNPGLRELDPLQREYIERLAHRQGLIKDIWNRFMDAMGLR